MGDIVLPTGEENNRQITVAQDQARKYLIIIAIIIIVIILTPGVRANGPVDIYIVCYISGNLSHR